MKLTDVNKDLTEAPADFGKRLRGTAKKAGERAKLELQAQTPFRRTTQKVAKAKIQIRKQASSIKNDFKVWMASAEDPDATPTAENFVNFITDEKPELASFVKDVGKAFGFLTPPKQEKPADGGGEEIPPGKVSKAPALNVALISSC